MPVPVKTARGRYVSDPAPCPIKRRCPPEAACIRLSGLAAVFLVFFNLPFALLAGGDATPSPAPQPSGGAPTPTQCQETFVDQEHTAVSRLLVAAVHKFDNFFGDESLEEEVQKPWVKIRGSVEWKEGWDFVFRQRFHCSLPLPVLEHKLHTFLSSDADDDFEDDKDFVDTEKDNDFTAGLRYFLRDTKHLTSNVSVGMQLKSKPVVYVKPRLQWDYSRPPYYLEAVQHVYWYSDDKWFGEDTAFYFNRMFGERWLARSVSSGNYGDDTAGVDLSQEFDIRYLDFSLRHDDHFATSLEWITEAHTWPSFMCHRHTLTLRLRHSIWRDWLRLEVAPRLTWERQKRDDDDEVWSDSWKKAAPSLILSLEILFEEIY